MNTPEEKSFFFEQGYLHVSGLLRGEVAVYAQPGDAVFINGAIWHTGGRNNTDALRRGIYIYYGYWWLKRYGAETDLPWEALEGASEQRLRLLGYKMPGQDLHMYAPGAEELAVA
jgi:ectoine hydroxylase-related dioxygenase (phytanoyl-CoA dioxygenase family)